MDLKQLLEKAVEQGASDVFLNPDAPPLMKVDGQMRPLGKALLGSVPNQRLIYSALDERDIEQFERTLELNKSHVVPGVGRFRINVFQQKGEPSLVARYIEDSIPTIEDPLEFVHRNRKSLVSQREVGIDTYSFEDALYNALREAPDVILIGEIRDRETMKQAIAFAETRHFCLATSHSSNAVQAMQRILNFFTEDTQVRLLQDLSLNLKAIISQRLCSATDGGRVAAVELMQTDPHISDLIQKGKLLDIPDAMERATGRSCLCFDDALFGLARSGRISEDEALRKADSYNNLSLRFRMETAYQETSFQTRSEVAVDEEAPFHRYRTYRIKPVQVEGHQPDSRGVLARAIGFALDEKGLRESTAHPDIEVRFSFAMKNVKALDLVRVDGQQRATRHFREGPTDHAMLVINVIDQNSVKSVYRLSALRRVSDLNESEIAVNQQILKVLESLPVHPSEFKVGATPVPRLKMSPARPIQGTRTPGKRPEAGGLAALHHVRAATRTGDRRSPGDPKPEDVGESGVCAQSRC